MDIKRRGLDRGLDSLLSARAKSVIGNNAEALVAETPQPGERVRELPVDLLQRGQYQPRRDFDDATLQELAHSIKAQGLIQPILVRSIPGNRYEIIAGERRWRASQLAGLDKIPAIVRDIGDKPAMAIALIENIQREDLNPLEEAFALHRLSEEFQLTHEQVSETVGKSRTTVTNLLRLLKLN
ncbi:MAG: ParB/RepB/Spo0J family partition protein, partial [Gammaproteobacteria bacterium]|nr:ParB/RepB/Spo0J family partition protein [Gammaproteobacteria bacterium]